MEKIAYSVPNSFEQLAPLLASSIAQIDQYEDPADVDTEMAKRWTEKKLKTCWQDYQLALVDGEIAGIFALWDGEEMELDDLYVAEKYRRQGVGRAIVQHCISQANNAGKALFLYVFKENTPARRLYEQMGFVFRQSVGTARMILVHPAEKP